MPDDRYQQIAIEFARHKATTESELHALAVQVQAIQRVMDETQKTMQAIQLDVAAIAASARQAAEVLARHVAEDRDAFCGLRMSTEAVSKAVWKIMGGVAVLVILVPLAVKYLLP